MKRVLLVLTLAAFAAAVYAGDPVEVWNEVYDSGESDLAQSVAVDALANVYVTGLTFNGADNDYLVIKYNPDGDTLWTRTFDGGSGNDHPYGIAVDALSNVYVAGASNNGTDYDWRTIKYDTDGNELWNVPFDGGNGDDWGFAVAADETGNVYVAGYSDNGTDDDLWIIKYNSDGDTLWTRTYDGGYNDGGRSVALDAAGNPCVTGYSFNEDNRDCRTICYDSQGNVRWNEVFDADSTDYGYGIAVDASGYVYVSGYTHNGTDVDYLVIKHNPDGDSLWTRTYDGGNGDDYGRGIAVDPYFVYVTGSSPNGTDSDFRTIRYDKEGNIGWNMVFDSGDNESGSGVAVDDSGYVYVTGWSNNGTDWDFRTIKYEQDDYPVAVSETPTPSPLALEVVDNLSSTPTLRYAIPSSSTGTLSFYSVDGRVIESFSIPSSQSIFAWDARNTPSGVYFARLVAAHQSVTVKTILTR